MNEIKIEQAKSDYQKIVSFIEDGSPLPPETDPYWEVCSALDRLGGFIADIEGAKNTEPEERKMDFNAMDNRKCAACDMVFDEDCDDCPAMPVMIKMWKDRAKKRINLNGRKG